MSQPQLDYAYELIKEERNAEALTVLEPLIRANRDNGDAWWLYANATNDPEAKRNALNNLLRIGANPAREEKVRLMLDALEHDADPFALPPKHGHAPQRRSGMSGRAKIALGIVVIFGLCACISVFVLGSFSSRLLYVPGNYDNQGTLIAGETVNGTIDTQGDWDGYLYRGQAGETLILSARSANDDFPPFVFLYGTDDLLVAFSNENSAAVNRLTEVLPEDGTYVILVRTAFGFGAGDYDLSLTSP